MIAASGEKFVPRAVGGAAKSEKAARRTASRWGHGQQPLRSVEPAASFLDMSPRMDMACSKHRAGRHI